MNAVIVFARRAGTLKLWSNASLVFIIKSILESEAKGSSLVNQKQSDSGRNIKALNYVRGYSGAVGL